MNKKTCCAVIVVSVLIVGLLFVCGGVADAQECRVIRIHGMAVHESVQLEPQTVVISKGTCVIWFNRAAAQEMKVVQLLKK
jgi:hypothetical protein